jgi:PEP-CTERM motif
VRLLWLFCAASAMAGPITYDVTVNTSSISGTVGSLDFNFNPGPPVTQFAQLQILSFTSDGSLAEACPCGIGDVGGQLPATLTFDNGSGLNDYFDNFTYGSTISFDVSLYGPALSAPDGVSTSGSTFAFSMFSDLAGTVPALTSNTTFGYAFTIDVNLDGSTTVTNFSPQTNVAAQSGGGTPSGSVPEPGSFLMVLVALGALAARSRTR